jgi:hypothetical protein
MARIERRRPRDRTPATPARAVKAPPSASDGGTPQRLLPEPANPLLGRRDGTMRPRFVQDLKDVEYYDVELG